MTKKNWADFWMTQDSKTHEIMRVNTAYFGERIRNFFLVKTSDTILDYGCGPGLLNEYLRQDKAKLTGVDINKAFIKECKEKFPDQAFFAISTDFGLNTEILDREFTHEFRFIILLSTAQYLRSSSEFEKLIGLLTRYLARDGQLIVADVIQPQSSRVSDTLWLLLYSFKQNRLGPFIRFMLNIFISEYRKISASVQLLTLSEAQVKQICSKHALACSRVDGLTIHRSRTSYVMKKMA